MAFIGSVNVDARSDSTNTELGLLAECPALAMQVIEVIGVTQRGRSYRLRFAKDGEALEWLATSSLRTEPGTTPLMRLQNAVFASFVREQLL